MGLLVLGTEKRGTFDIIWKYYYLKVGSALYQNPVASLNVVLLSPNVQTSRRNLIISFATWAPRFLPNDPEDTQILQVFFLPILPTRKPIYADSALSLRKSDLIRSAFGEFGSEGWDICPSELSEPYVQENINGAHRDSSLPTRNKHSINRCEDSFPKR